MKRFIFAFLIFTSPALAQQRPYQPVAVSLLEKALECESVATNAVDGMAAQVKAVTAERDTQLKATHEAEQANVQLKASADEREAHLKAVTAERDALKAATQLLAQ